jgi:tetratricopeptide (TPR) repeat protein
MFIRSLRRGLSDLTTVKDRIARCREKPAYPDAVFLARYMSEAGEHLEAIKYYRKAGDLGIAGRAAFYYEIFENTANAVWKEMIPFEEIFAPADAVMDSPRKKSDDIIKVVRVMSRVARKFNKGDKIAKYLRAGIDLTANGSTKTMKDSHIIFTADYALYVDGDTAGAVRIKKSAMGAGWQSDPERYYDYAKWCLERKIMLDEAEYYAREAGKRSHAGEFRAKVLNTLAEVLYERGNNAEAIRIIEMAIEEDPGKELYEKQLRKFRGESPE